MRIAIFSDTYTPEVNGVARTLKRYTDYLEKVGIEYKLFVPESRTPNPTVPQVERFTSIPFALYPECRIALPNPLSINETLKTFRPTLIHVLTPFNLGIYGAHYGKKNNIPMVASYHTNFDDYLTYYHLQFMKKWIWKYMTWFHRPFEKVYVPSPSTKAKLLSKRMHPNIDIWGRGVDAIQFSPEKKSDKIRMKYQIQEKNIVLYVGRLSPEKDIDIVFDTFHSLPKELKKSTHLVIVGDGPLYQTLSTDHCKQITFTGFLEREELAEMYASTDVFLFPSPTETFGNVVLEAQASGLPVIGANAGGVQHLLQDNQNGFLCKPKSVNDFVTKTTTLLTNDQLRQDIGKKARAFALEQSWNRIFDRLIASFEDILEVKTRKSA
ncbi:glycosyltransferase involved in cell wall biosynthesis [Natronobacillus azotifigens]|uniref:Glycosyltransferase family 1 protein n=1 Tax=Natronobacillus azotifigens TaxID=472978 RepID=A0A9J6RAG0_9BACI|nr:glycosyltransferase family 1 protein [Natronobacillus azotifigens]MCZ0702292.1 glycosyltransferase family 1 protein [Natronobacillus azotifigens]